MLKIGIAYSLKPVGQEPVTDGPDDRFEEFDRPETVEAIARVIRNEGHDVILMGDGREFLETMLANAPDFVFNIAEGQGIGRDREARVPAVCEMLGVPYSGSDPLTLASSLDKNMARILVRNGGGLCPAGSLLRAGMTDEEIVEEAMLAIDDTMSGHLILKPAFEGSSKGIRDNGLVFGVDDVVRSFRSLSRDYSQPILMEEFVDGDEITVGVLGNGPEARVLGIMRIVPKDSNKPFVYSLDVKRDWESRVQYESPADLAPHLVEAIEESALLVYEALGCRDFARIDFRVNEDRPYFIEANPLPGLAPVTSDLVILAEGYGVSHDQLIAEILRIALKRVRLADGPLP